ncbi:MAG: inositol monophosphatase family protein [Kofleriaceae bacterium]
MDITDLDLALGLARDAGAEVVRIRDGGALGVELKPGDEPVTVADRTANEMIVAGLRAAYPADAIISEEAVAIVGTGARRWYVDPIDGTKEFIRGSDGFSVMFGLCEGARPVLGVVHQPTVGRTFFASPAGAFVELAGERKPLAVSAIHDAAAARLVASASQRSADIDRVKSTLGISDEQNIGSVGVMLALIALGVRDLYVNPWPKTKAWDTCAPEAILARAGDRLGDLFGGPVDYRGELAHRRGLVASNGHVHDEVLARLAPLFAPKT